MTIKTNTIFNNEQSLAKTQRVDLFAMAIVEGNTQSDAYRRAYPKSSSKWKQATIHNKACNMAKTDEVLARVVELKADQKIKHHATIDDILFELTCTSTFDPRDLFDEEGNKKLLFELPIEVRKAVSLQETDDGVAWQFKQSDKNKSISLMGEWYQMWKENVLHPGSDSSGPVEHKHVHIHMTAEEATKVYKEAMNSL